MHLEHSPLSAVTVRICMFVSSRTNLHTCTLPLAGSRSPLVKYARGSHIGFPSTSQTRSCALRMPRYVTFTLMTAYAVEIPFNGIVHPHEMADYTLHHYLNGDLFCIYLLVAYTGDFQWGTILYSQPYSVHIHASVLYLYTGGLFYNILHRSMVANSVQIHLLVVYSVHRLLNGCLFCKRQNYKMVADVVRVNFIGGLFCTPTAQSTHLITPIKQYFYCSPTKIVPAINNPRRLIWH